MLTEVQFLHLYLLNSTQFWSELHEIALKRDDPMIYGHSVLKMVIPL